MSLSIKTKWRREVNYMSSIETGGRMSQGAFLAEKCDPETTSSQKHFLFPCPFLSSACPELVLFS